MADYGFRAVNPDGTVQVDSQFRNLAFRASGSASLSSSPVAFWRYGSAVVPNGNGRIIAWRCNYPAALTHASTSGDNITLNFRSYTGPSNSAAPTLTWYLFDEPGAVSIPSNQFYGMIVRDAAGNKTYDSRIPYAKWVDQISGTSSGMPLAQNGSSPSFTNYSYPGMVPAVVQGNLSTYVAEVPTNVGNHPDFMSIFQAVMARQSGSTLSLASCGLGVGPYQTPTNTPTVSRPNWSYTIIDVSGL